MRHAARQLPSWLIFDVRRRQNAMKTIVKKGLGCALGFLIFAQLPVIGQNNEASGFIGEWTNKDFNTRSVTRVHIRRDGEKVVVHEWGRCHPRECDWGEAIAVVSGSALLITWKPRFAIMRQELTLLRDGGLQVVTHTHFTDNSGRKDSVSKDTLVKGLVHDWSDPAPK